MVRKGIIGYFFFLPNLYCCCSVVSDSLWPHEQQHTSFPTLHHLPELAQTHAYWVSDAIQAAHPLLSPSVTSFSLSQHQGLFHWVLSSYQVATYWSFSFSISPSNEYSGLIFFRIYWFDLLPLQGTLKNLLQHHSSKTSILWCSAFLMVQFSHLVMTTGKTIALTIWNLAK